MDTQLVLWRKRTFSNSILATYITISPSSFPLYLSYTVPTPSPLHRSTHNLYISTRPYICPTRCSLPSPLIFLIPLSCLAFPSTILTTMSRTARSLFLFIISCIYPSILVCSLFIQFINFCPASPLLFSRTCDITHDVCPFDSARLDHLG